MTSRAAHALLLVLLPLFVACRPVPECQVHAECADGQGCVLGQCEDVECLSSSECAIEQYCNQESYNCTPGCEFSEDCYVGDRCDALSNTCVTRRCTDTQRDCDGGERCDQATGECYLDPGPHCEPCNGQGQCGANAECFAFSGGGGGYCFVECNPEAVEACPAGFQCTLVNGSLHYCVSFCPLL